MNLLIICLKCISEERFLFNVNVKIINASLKILIKRPTQKAKFYKNLYINQIQNQFEKLFKSTLWYCFNIKLLKFLSTIFFFLHFLLLTWNIFLCLAFCSSQIWLDIPLNFAPPFRIMTHNSYEFLSWNIIFFGQKQLIKVQFSRLWVLEWKFKQFLMSILKPQGQVLFKFCITFHCNNT